MLGGKRIYFDSTHSLPAYGYILCLYLQKMRGEFLVFYLNLFQDIRSKGTEFLADRKNANMLVELLGLMDPAEPASTIVAAIQGNQAKNGYLTIYV